MPSQWRSAPCLLLYNNAGLSGSSQETRQSQILGIKLMLFGHLTESVPQPLAESQFLEHNSQQATAHSLTYIVDQVLCKQENKDFDCVICF